MIQNKKNGNHNLMEKSLKEHLYSLYHKNILLLNFLNLLLLYDYQLARKFLYILKPNLSF
jgi:hypothetical protein